MATYKLAIYYSPHDYTEPYRVAIISPVRHPEKADGTEVYEPVMVVDLGVSDLPLIRTDELLTAPSVLHVSAGAFGLLAEPFSGNDPLERDLDEPHHDSLADRLHGALKRGQPSANLDDDLGGSCRSSRACPLRSVEKRVPLAGCLRLLSAMMTRQVLSLSSSLGH